MKQPKCQRALWCFSMIALIALALFALAACGFGAATPSENTAGGGGSTPEIVAKNFFEDLRQALKDPQLSNENKRGQWVERLANYFAPNERDDQRVALSSALDNFVDGLGKLAPNENLSLDVRFEEVKTVSEQDDRAMVRPINGSIDILITRTAAGGATQTLWEQSVPLNQIVGDANGAVPVIRIGRNWFLTEG